MNRERTPRRWMPTNERKSEKHAKMRMRVTMLETNWGT